MLTNGKKSNNFLIHSLIHNLLSHPLTHHLPTRTLSHAFSQIPSHVSSHTPSSNTSSNSRTFSQWLSCWSSRRQQNAIAGRRYDTSCVRSIQHILPTHLLNIAYLLTLLSYPSTNYPIINHQTLSPIPHSPTLQLPLC